MENSSVIDQSPTSENQNQIRSSQFPILPSQNQNHSGTFSLAISIRNKTGFLDGTIPVPDLGDALYRPWLCCNNLVLTWLLNSVSREIASSVLYINSAKEVRDTLKSRYSHPDNVHIYQLQQLHNSTTQGNLTITEYFTALNAIWEEIRSYRPTTFCSCGNCTCHGLRSVSEIQLVDYAFKFLMGLGDSYEGIRGQILLMSPMPSLDRIFSIVLQEERQREARIITQPPVENSAMAVSSTIVKRKFRNNVIYEHCAKTGHVKAECYRIIGFPESFKFTKNKHIEDKGFIQRQNQGVVVQGNTSYANNVQGDTSYPVQGGRNVQYPANQVTYVQGNHVDKEKLGLTQEQLQRLIHHLNKESPTVNNTEKIGEGTHFSNMAEIGSFYKDDDWTI